MRGRGIMMIQLVPGILALSSGIALSAPERHIPRGELTPEVIEKVFDSPRGELQFTVVAKTKARSGYLRNVKGRLLGITEVRGGGGCEAWYASSKSEMPPRSCEFLFYDDAKGLYLSVRADEMQESDIFGLASGEIQFRIGRSE